MNQLIIDGPKKLISSIPSLIKINPINKLLIFGLKGAESRFSTHFSYQIPTLEILTSKYFDNLLKNFIGHDLESVVLVFYIEKDPEKYKKIAQIYFERLSKKVYVKDLLWVKKERWASFICEDLSCCPIEGNVIEKEPKTKEIHKFNTDFLKINKVDSKLKTNAQKAMKIKSAIKDDLGLKKWQKMQFNRLSSKNAISTASKNNWSRLLVGLKDIPVRDALLSHFIERGLSNQENSKKLIALAKTWAKVGSFAEQEFQSPIFACVSAYLWQAGEYEAANIAVKLSLAADANFRLALLLQNAIDSGVPASEFKDIFKNPSHPWT